jgi:hypothetical protein
MGRDGLIAHIHAYPTDDRPEILGLHANAARAIGDKEGTELLQLFYKFNFEEVVAVRADVASLTFEP